DAPYPRFRAGGLSVSPNAVWGQHHETRPLDLPVRFARDRPSGFTVGSAYSAGKSLSHIKDAIARSRHDHLGEVCEAHLRKAEARRPRLSRSPQIPANASPDLAICCPVNPNSLPSKAVNLANMPPPSGVGGMVVCTPFASRRRQVASMSGQ